MNISQICHQLGYPHLGTTIFCRLGDVPLTSLTSHHLLVTPKVTDPETSVPTIIFWDGISPSYPRSHLISFDLGQYLQGLEDQSLTWLVTLWKFNIAIETGTFIEDGDFP